MPFTFTRLRLPEVILIQPRIGQDNRGYFRETFKASEFAAFGLSTQFVQSNHSHSTRNVVRALHYQKNPQAQDKLIAVAQGAVFDVAVDIRRGSPTYGAWVGAQLSAENGHLLYIPAGFAHGFCVLGESADLVYQVTAEWSPQHETGIFWNDPAIGIDWPIRNPVLSARDLALPMLDQADNNFVLTRAGIEIGD
jgi:dTDP-4-dehydrorhamnose 3,5-epimerase